MSISLNSPGSEIEDRSLNGSERVLVARAGAPLQDLYDSPECPELLRTSLAGSISWQQRCEITVQQALLSPNLAPLWISTLLACGARVSFPDPSSGESLLASFLKRSDPRHGELEAVLIPLDVPGRLWGSAQMGRTPADRPIVAAVAVVDLSRDRIRQARLALSGVWQQHVRLAESTQQLIGERLSPESIQQVAAAVRREVQPASDWLGSVEYRKAMAGVLASRALHGCLEQLTAGKA